MAGRILVVDDSTTIQKVIKIAFSRLGVDVVTASSFIEALSEIGRQKIDILVIDASLSESRGIEDFKKLQADSKAQVLLLIGSYETVDEGALEAAGFHHQIKKPFESQDIVQAVTKVLGAGFFGPDANATSEAESSSESEEAVHLPPIQSGGEVDGEENILPPLPNLARSIPISNQQGVPPLASRGFIPPPPPPPQALGKGGTDSIFAPVPQDLPPLPKIDEGRRGQKAFHITEGGAPSVAQGGFVPVAAPEKKPSFNAPSEPSFKPKAPAAPPSPQAEREPINHDSELIKLKLESFLEGDAPQIVRKAVEEYCQKHFAKLARDILTGEIRRLADEKARLLTDN